MNFVRFRQEEKFNNQQLTRYSQYITVRAYRELLDFVLPLRSKNKSCISFTIKTKKTSLGLIVDN